VTAGIFSCGIMCRFDGNTLARGQWAADGMKVRHVCCRPCRRPCSPYLFIALKARHSFHFTAELQSHGTDECCRRVERREPALPCSFRNGTWISSANRAIVFTADSRNFYHVQEKCDKTLLRKQFATFPPCRFSHHQFNRRRPQQRQPCFVSFIGPSLRFLWP